MKLIRKLLNLLTKEEKIQVKYPMAITFDELPLMPKNGTYKNKFPEGIIVHFTAGWQNQKGIDAVKSAIKNGHRYFFIDEKGQVFQQFCLSGHGSHAGVSKCPVTKRTSVSQYYVGIEIACGGKLENGKTWFGKEVKDARNGYEKYTEAQELSLKKLCTWLCENGANPDLILGHDEVAPDRKNDPGQSLSVSMKEFRELIKGSL